MDHPQAVIRHDKEGRPFNSKAGPIRNQETIDAGADMCLALHRALAAGIPTYLIDSEAGEPKRLQAGDERMR